MVESEEGGHNCTGDGRQADPRDRQVPEADDKGRAAGARRPQRRLDLQVLVVEARQLADVGNAGPQDDGDGGSVLDQPEADVAVQERAPRCGRREQHGDETRAGGAHDGVEKGRQRRPGMCALQLESRLVEVDDAVEQREHTSAEVRHVLHRPVVGVEDGQQGEHPPGVDEGPSHDGQEVDVEARRAQLVHVFREHREGVRDAEDGERLGREAGKDDAAEAGAQDHLDGAPHLARQNVQVAGEGDAGQQVGEDVDGTRHDLLVEDGPVGRPAPQQVAQVLP